MLEAVPMAALLTDSGGNVRHVNGKFEELTGYDEAAIGSFSFNSLLSGASSGVYPDTGRFPLVSHSFEARFRCKNGTAFISEVRIEEYRDQEEGPGYFIVLNDITAARLREEELGAKKETYRLLVENQSDLIVQFDSDYRLTFASPSYCETFGLAFRERVGEHFYHHVHEDDYERVKQSLHSVTSPPFHSQYQERAYTVHGWRWFGWVVRSVKDEEGTVISIVGIGRDITGQKEAEQSLRQSEERYRRLFEEAIDGIALADPETGILVDCNAALCSLVGRSREELIGAKQTILHPPDPSDEDLTETFRRHRSRELGRELPSEVITKEGEIRQVIIKANMIETSEGRFLQGIFHDITEYQRAMEEIESLAKFPEENPNPILRVSQEGRILYSNDAAAGLLTAWNTEQNDLLPRQYAKIAARTLRSKKSSEKELTANERIYLTLFVPVTKFDYINIYARDITERKKKEEQLNALATTDSLTGLFNRRHFVQLAEREIDRSTRYDNPLTMLMFDIDHFKKVNDTYGHRTGDTVLTALGDAARRLFRAIDLLARIGGEEFAVLMPETNCEQALHAAERFRSEIEALSIGSNGTEVSITVSIGVSSLETSEPEIGTLMHHADIALYEAKRTGRNRIVTYQPQ